MSRNHPDSSVLGEVQQGQTPHPHRVLTTSFEFSDDTGLWRQLWDMIVDSVTGMITTQRLIILAASVLGLIVVDRVVKRRLGVSPLYIVVLLLWAGVAIIIRELSDTPTGGRRRYDSGPLDEARRLLWYARRRIRGESVRELVDYVDRRNPNKALCPVFDTATSMMLLGMTGMGKSTFMKRLGGEWWSLDDGILAHTVTSEGTRNEWAEFFAACGYDVIKLSSRGSDMRWNPFLDCDGSVQDLTPLARRLLNASDAVETGWTKPAETMLVAALAMAMVNDGDFATLQKVLEQDRQSFLSELKHITDDIDISTELNTLQEWEHNNFKIAQAHLINELLPLFHSDICDESLPTLSLETYLENPTNRVIVLHNLEKDDTQMFWRVIVETAIDIALESQHTQRFLLDEFTKLPSIDNLDSLVSHGRSENATAMLAAQDIHQITDTYGELAESLWANAPNKVCFRPGDKATADLALGTLGEGETMASDVTTPTSLDKPQQTHSIATQPPIESERLMECRTGEALIDSENGWWLCKLAKD